MNRLNRTRYTTGAFAKLFGIKKDTLLYYDKINVFKPSFIGQNGYRYYEAGQIEQFWALSSLRDVGMPLKELEHYVQEPSPERLYKITCEQAEQVEREIQRLQRISDNLQHMKAITKEALQAPLEKLVFTEILPESVLYSDSLGAEDTASNTHWGEAYTSFVKEAGATGIFYTGSVIALKDVQQNNFERIDRLYMKINENTQVVSASTPEVRPGGLYGVIYFKGSYARLIESYPQFIEAITERGFTVSGDIYEEYLVNQVATNDESRYITKILIPVIPVK